MDSLVVAVAAGIQIATAALFLVQAVVAYRYGDAAQAAAEAEVVKQGFPVEVLAQRGVKFKESAAEMPLPVGIAVVLLVLASLNLAGVAIGRIITWIFQSIFLVVGGFVTASQVFSVQQLESAFKKSGDTTLQAIDVRKFVAAAMSAFPPGFRYLVVARFVLTTVGSALVIVLLALPPAGDTSIRTRDHS
jgi:hypothetical protein